MGFKRAGGQFSHPRKTAQQKETVAMLCHISC
jgi:hypothetical protein